MDIFFEQSLMMIKINESAGECDGHEKLHIK